MATRDSKSKTFQKESDMGELMQWVLNAIETDHSEIPSGATEPSLDVKTELRYKYIVTISAVHEGL